jgi:hypothetical protein
MQQLYLVYIVLAIAVMCIGLRMCSNGQGQGQGQQLEGFALSPDSFPTYPLLKNDYPLKNPGGLSNLSADDLWSYYPVFDNSYGQYTNNVRYWEVPDNGRCSRAEVCCSLYDSKPIKKMRIAPAPKPISFNADARRVNFYASDPMTCPDAAAPDVANCLHYGHKTNSLTPPYQPTMLDS